MEDIYDKIRDKVNNPSEVKATDKEWNSFLAHREAREVIPSKKAVWPYWAIGSLLILFGLSNAYWMMSATDGQLVGSKRNEIVDTVYITKYVDRETTVKNDQEIISKADLKRDLVQMTNQYTKLQSSLHKMSFKLTQLESSNIVLESKYATFYNQEKIFEKLNESNLLDNIYNSRDIESPVINQQLGERLTLNTLYRLPILDYQNIEYLSRAPLHSSSITLIKNERKFNLLNAITPKSLSINGNAAYVINPKDSNLKGIGFELRATTFFSNVVRGYFGFSLLKNKSRLDDVGMTIPDVPYPQLAEGDVIEHSDEIISKLSLNIGIEYLLNLESRWRPFAGVGYGRVVRNIKKYQFEIKSTDGSEYYIDPERGISLENYNQIILSLGTDFNLSSKIEMRLGLEYISPLNNFNHPGIWLKGGGYYNF